MVMMMMVMIMLMLLLLMVIARGGLLFLFAYSCSKLGLLNYFQLENAVVFDAHLSSI